MVYVYAVYGNNQRETVQFLWVGVSPRVSHAAIIILSSQLLCIYQYQTIGIVIRHAPMADENRTDSLFYPNADYISRNPICSGITACRR